MGLDMYLYRAKKKINTQEELEKLNEINDMFYEDKKKAYQMYFNYNTKHYNSELISKHTNKMNDFIQDMKIFSSLDIGYWRKHSDLHGYFESLYRDRGGEKIFNCIPLLLTKEDCEDVINSCKAEIAGEKLMDKAEGFFWGSSTKEDWVDTLKIFTKAIKETDFDKESIFYSSWW